MPIVYQCDNHPNRETDVQSVQVNIAMQPVGQPATTQMKSAYLCPQCRDKLNQKLVIIFEAGN